MTLLIYMLIDLKRTGFGLISPNVQDPACILLDLVSQYLSRNVAVKSGPEWQLSKTYESCKV